MDKPVSFEFVGLTPVVDLLDRYKLEEALFTSA